MRIISMLICLLIFGAPQLEGQVIQTLDSNQTAVIIDSDTVIVNNTEEPINNGLTIEQRADSIIHFTSSDSFTAPSYMFKPSPRKAVIYSAIFPGMGQIYNRQYWKLPILYSGFVGFTYAITWNNGYYRDYLGGYQDIMDSNPDTNRWHKMLPYGMEWESVDTKWFADVLKQRKDYYRYYRDLSIIGTFALYLLAIVDAYVDSQLYDFDMSPDLSMRISPTLLKEERTNYIGNSYGLQWSFSF
jgi:hypothetical protein